MSTLQILRNGQAGKTITFEFFNGFDGSPLGGGSMKYDRYKAMNGYYTRIWRKFRPGLANIYELDKRLVRARVWIDDKLLTPSTHN